MASNQMKSSSDWWLWNWKDMHVYLTQNFGVVSEKTHTLTRLQTIPVFPLFSDYIVGITMFFQNALILERGVHLKSFSTDKI